MKKIFLLAIALATMVSCGKKDDKSAEALASSGNLAAMKEKRASLQSQIMQLDEAIAKLDTIKELALVSVAPVKDTVFNHYIEIQGNVDTKENLIIYPQFSGTLLTLNVIAGQKVSKGQVLG